jgi:hypothetical protein
MNNKRKRKKKEITQVIYFPMVGQGMHSHSKRE